MGQLLLIQKGKILLTKELNKSTGESRIEQRKVSVKKKGPKPPTGSAEEYMAYLNMQGSARLGV